MSGKILQNKATALKIAGGYALAGGLWILFSDGLMGKVFTDIPTLIKISTFKGWFFIGVTSWLLYIFIRRDIGALEQSIARIEDEKAKSESILAAVGDGIRILDTDFKILYENKAHQNFFGRHAGEYCYKAYAGKDSVCEHCPVKMTFSDGLTHRSERSVPSNSGVKYFESSAFPLKDSNGRIVAGIEVIRDATIRKKTEGDLLRTKRLESIGIFARGLSHDFNNLLTGILGNISLAKISLRPEDPTFILLTKAEDSCLRAEDLIYQLHTVAKSSESGRKTLSIIGLIKEASRFALNGSQIECKYHLPDDLWPVTVDEDQINQAIYNIIVNASDAMKDKGHITISAENAVVGPDNSTLRKGNYIKISIEDEGSGIEEKLLPNIFDPYFTTKKLGSSKATGFSLAASYFAVKNHKGYIFAESTVGKGSAFFIYLPTA